MKQLVTIISIAFLLLSCNSKNSILKDKPDTGIIYISVDESFRPAIEEQIKMYELSYPNTHIIAEYKSEADCLKDFFRDSVNRLVIIGRGLNNKEEHFMIDSLGYNPGCNAIASDAVTFILNKKNSDSLFTIEKLKNQLQGKLGTKNTFVFDGLNATSTVRFIKDSILKGDNYDTAVVKAAKNSKDVIEYVSTHENAIGLVGYSWIGNPEDSTQIKALKNIKLGYVKCEVCEGNPYVKPMQENLLTMRYPLVRKLYYIIKENYTGLGSGFVSFLKYERGQLIFRRAYLGPVMNLEIRNVQINKSLPKN
jgi:phosphate transport system substrate-binding protein